MTTTPLPPLPTPTRPAVFATSQNTESVRKGYEMGGYEKEPPLFDENQMAEYATQARADLEAENQRLREALRIAINQNEHDMLMTGEELRQARAVLKGQP